MQDVHDYDTAEPTRLDRYCHVALDAVRNAYGSRRPHAAIRLRRNDGEQIYFESVEQIGGTTPAGMGAKLRETTYALDVVRQMSLPVLMIVGADDQTFPPAAIQSVAAEIKGAQTVVLPGAGHSPYFETPDAWNEAVMKFFGSVTPP